VRENATGTPAAAAISRPGTTSSTGAGRDIGADPDPGGDGLDELVGVGRRHPGDGPVDQVAERGRRVGAERLTRLPAPPGDRGHVRPLAGPGREDLQHYRLHPARTVLDPDAITAMSNDDHRRRFTAPVASLLAEFEVYLDRNGADPLADDVSYRQYTLWLSDAEKAAFYDDLVLLLRRRPH